MVILNLSNIKKRVLQSKIDEINQKINKFSYGNNIDKYMVTVTLDEKIYNYINSG